MRRLAIIDPAGGKQPVYNEDRSVVVVLQLEAGHLLEVDLASGSGRERAYWDVPLGAPEAASSDDEWAARADAAIGSAVRQRRAARCLSFRRR
jgi:asparagine synthetase B (glutamine-hydrolysing)